MGILNLTPDSFFDGAELGKSSAGGFSVDLDKVLFRAERMVSAGATILDIGGESTRPGAASVPEQEQLDRVLPALENIRRNLDVCLSVDTSAPAVIRESIAAGAEIINDIRALTVSGAIDAVADSAAAVCLMHMQGEPASMQQTYRYGDVVTEVNAFLKDRIEACRSRGIADSRLLIDPGFGFGKSLDHNYSLLRHLPGLADAGLPILVGISRKSMIGAVVERPVDQCLAGTVAATMLALDGGAHIIRTHDVAATVDAIRVHCAFKNAE